MLRYEKLKKNIVKTIKEIKINSGLDTCNIRVLCPICGGKFWGYKKYKHFNSPEHQKKLCKYLNSNSYDKNINKDVFIVNIDFW
jgi:hypothetical protein